jgi:hypothetical protein
LALLTAWGIILALLTRSSAARRLILANLSLAALILTALLLGGILLGLLIPLRRVALLAAGRVAFVGLIAGGRIVGTFVRHVSLSS